jgi:cell division protein YceG involved in septum cleavage
VAKRSYKKKSNKKWSVFISIPLLVLVILMIYSAWFFAQTVALKKTIDITIQDKSISTTIQLLEQKGIIDSPFPILVIAELYGIFLNKQCAIGEYRILPTLTHGQLLKLIFSGKQSYTVNVSFPEGIQVKKIASICAQQLGTDDMNPNIFASIFSSLFLLT